MPGRIVIFHRLASREYLDAKRRYAGIRAELGQSFVEEIGRAVQRISENPE